MYNLDLLVTGVVTGSFYALMAAGLSLVFGLLKIVNFSHGEFYTIGAYTYCLLNLKLGWPPFLTLATAPLLGALIGVVTERLLIKPLYLDTHEWAGWRDEYAVIVTFGLSLLIINAANQFIGPYAFRGASLIESQLFSKGPIRLSMDRALAFFLSCLAMTGLIMFLGRTPWGRSIRAVSQNRFAASIAGIDTGRVSMVVLAVSGALAAFTGALLAPIFHAYPMVGQFPALKSYIIVVLGGMGSVTGSLVGAVFLGVFESFCSGWLSYAYRDAFAFILLLLVLLVRPMGLFGESTREV